MIRPLSQFLQEPFIKELRIQVDQGAFPGLTFEQAMRFLLLDGLLPASDLPLESFLKLEDWARNDPYQGGHFFSATELKNKTGTIIEEALQGKRIFIHRHGRPILEIKATKNVFKKG